jgi:nitroreductase
MDYSKSVFEIIPQRKSVRTYADAPVPKAALRALDGNLKSLPAPPFRSTVRFALAAAAPDDTEALKGLGTYGIIRNPAGFVIGAAECSDRGLVDFGHQMEAIVLSLADLGLGSCWLGGSFRKNRFTERIAASETECVPSVVSFGVPADKPRAFEKFMRKGAGSDLRKPFETLFFRSDFGHPMVSGEAGSFGRLLEMVRLAPSASNRQPWRVVWDEADASHHFFLRRDRGYGRRLKWFGAIDLQMVDMGIAACHFELTAREDGMPGSWSAADPKIRNAQTDTEYVMSWVTTGRSSVHR